MPLFSEKLHEPHKCRIVQKTKSLRQVFSLFCAALPFLWKKPDRTHSLRVRTRHGNLSSRSQAECTYHPRGCGPAPEKKARAGSRKSRPLRRALSRDRFRISVKIF